MRFELLSPIWEGDSVPIPFGDEVDRDYLTVIGWTDLSMGQPCKVNIARVQNGFVEGFLIWGGNSGLRVLDDRRKPESWEAHLPAGWGMPIIWVDDHEDLPDEVRAVVVAEEEDPQEPEDIDQRCWPQPRVRNPKGTY